MYREDGSLAARGRHVKYLPMGPGWDLCAKSWLFPLAQRFNSRRHAKRLTDPEAARVRMGMQTEQLRYGTVRCGAVRYAVAYDDWQA